MEIQILERFQHQPLLMSRDAAMQLQYLPHAKTNRDPDDFLCQLMAESGVDNVKLLSFHDRKPYPVLDGGIAIISVKGTLYAGEQYWGNYYTGYESIEMRYARALADPDVKGIVLDINSSGGEAAGCLECGDVLFAGRSAKPVWAHVKHKAYSAGYWTASSADKIYGTPSSGLGSIGVLVAHFDYSKMFEQMGVGVTLISAGSHKTDGNPYGPLPKAVRAKIKENVERTNDVFVAAIARNRGLEEQVIRDLEADTFQIDQAIEIGLADGKKTAQEFYADFLQHLSQTTTTGGILAMTDEAKSPGNKPDNSGADAETTAQISTQANEQAGDQARTAERERIGSILKCEEAEGKQKLASHLATSTDLSLDAAKAVLAAASTETEPTAEVPNLLEQAMAGEASAEVGAGLEQETTEADPLKPFAMYDKAHPSRVPVQ